MTAATNAYSAFKLTLANPGDAIANDLQAARIAQYNLGWHIYTNQAFNLLPGWATYAATLGLYGKTRPIYNPATVIVDFYASHVFQGVLTEDGASLPSGEQLAIPLSRDTSPELRAAIAQLWQWGNWQQKMRLWVIYGASMGDSFVEGVEDVDRGRVWPQVVPAPHIKEVDFDERGNVIYYEKEYGYYSREDKRPYTYKKIVSKEKIETFRDGAPYAYSVDGASYDNPFGFVPLVYNAHRDLGIMPGAPAVRNWNKIEILNSLATRVDAYIRTQSQSPTVIIGEGLKVSGSQQDATKALEEEIKILIFEGEGSIAEMKGNLDIAAAEKRIESMLTEVEHDHPEATMYSQLRSMGEVTGVAAEILMGDVKGHVFQARVGYDDASKRIFQMLISMGAMRAQDRLGGWQNLTEQQKKFLPFDLNSFERGDLDFDIDPRPLIPITSIQKWEEKSAMYRAMAEGVAAMQPIEWQMKQDGASEEQIAEYQKAAQSDMFGDGFMAQPQEAVA